MDIIKTLKLPVLVITDTELGTINSTILTINYLTNNNVQIKGIVFNRYKESVMEDNNIDTIKKATQVPVVSLVKNNESDIDININELRALYKEVNN